MSFTTMFLQHCPTCGRRLEVQVQYLGKTICCPHCRGSFLANNAGGTAAPQTDVVEHVLREAEIYLASVDEINEVAQSWQSQHPAGSSE